MSSDKGQPRSAAERSALITTEATREAAKLQAETSRETSRLMSGTQRLVAFVTGSFMVAAAIVGTRCGPNAHQRYERVSPQRPPYLASPALVHFTVRYHYPDPEAPNASLLQRAWDNIFKGREPFYEKSVEGSALEVPVPRSALGRGEAIIAMRSIDQNGTAYRVIGRGYYHDEVVVGDAETPLRITWGGDFRTDELKPDEIRPGAKVVLHFTVRGRGTDRDFRGEMELGSNDWLLQGQRIPLVFDSPFGPINVAELEISDRQPLEFW